MCGHVTTPGQPSPPPPSAESLVYSDSVLRSSSSSTVLVKMANGSASWSLYIYICMGVSEPLPSIATLPASLKYQIRREVARKYYGGAQVTR